MATTAIAVGTMKAAQVSIPEQISRLSSARFLSRVQDTCGSKVQACGVCHSDVLTKEGLWPGIQYPRIPGHEVSASLMKSRRCFRLGERQRVGVGCTAAMTGRVANAGAEILITAATCKFRVSATTAATRNTWSRRQKRSWLCRTH